MHHYYIIIIFAGEESIYFERRIAMEKRLYRSRGDRMLGGVCGGIAEYFNIDSSLVRILWVLFTLMGGSGLLIYLICLVVIPSR